MESQSTLNLYAGENGIARGLIPRNDFLIVMLKNLDVKVRRQDL